jgi:hypothetical protein
MQPLIVKVVGSYCSALKGYSNGPVSRLYTTSLHLNSLTYMTCLHLQHFWPAVELRTLVVLRVLKNETHLLAAAT